jgi:RNA polymerase sigma-70 factor (ECF subfamily)
VLGWEAGTEGGERALGRENEVEASHEAEPGRAPGEVDWIAEHLPEVAKFVRAVVGDVAHLDDLMQETVVRALDSIHRFDPERPIRPWLCGIALNVCHKHWRRLRRDRSSNPVLVPVPGTVAVGDDPESQLASREFLARLRLVMDELSPRLRDALVLTCCQEYTVDEVAAMLGTTPSVVHTRVCRARQILRRRLRGDRDECGGDA